MADAIKAEGESLARNDVNAFLREDEPTKNQSGLAALTSQVDAARKTEETQQEIAVTQVAKSRKTYEGTNIKARNPIIVVMLIMQVVSDTLKDAGDNTKEVTKLSKKEWKLFSEKQSKNFLDGKNSMEDGDKYTNYGMMITSGSMVGKFALSHMFAQNAGIAKWIVDNAVLKMANDLEGAQSLLGSTATQLSSGIAQKGQMQMQLAGQEVQIKQSLFEHEVASRNSDYQNLSQLSSSDSQAKEGATEKGIQLARLSAQMLTGQPA